MKEKKKKPTDDGGASPVNAKIASQNKNEQIYQIKCL